MKIAVFNPAQLADMDTDGVRFDPSKHAGRYFDARLRESREIRRNPGS